MYSKPAGLHPLEVQRLHFWYTWLLCLICFFMLIGVTGLVQHYDSMSEGEEHSIDDDEYRTAEIVYRQNIVYAFSMEIPCVILLKMFEKVYYREKLLSGRLFTWVESIYKSAQEEELREEQEALNNRMQVAEEGKTKHIHSSETVIN